MSLIDQVVTVHEAKSQLSRLIAEVEGGELSASLVGKVNPQSC